jgi:hypothetical protein
MTKSDAEAYLIKNGNRGYPANQDDILAQYGEEAYESRANGLRAPAYSQWLQQQVDRRERAKSRENSRERLLATPEGKEIEREFQKASKLHKEAREEVNKSRDTLEAKFKEVHGQYLDQYMDEQSARRGLSMSEIDDRIKSIIPEEHAKLEKAHAIEQALYDRYTTREKARNSFFSGSDAGSQSQGRVARSEKDFFPTTILPNGDMGLDLNNMSNKQLKSAYKQFKTPDTLGDTERRSSDKREFNRISKEMEDRGL